MNLRYLFLILCSFFLASNAFAAETAHTSYSLVWGIPFAGILLSIALFPLIAPTFWHHHYGKVVAIWTALFIVPFVANFGSNSTLSLLTHAVLEEYIPFIILLFSLFTVSGGILIKGNLHGSPKLNTGLLALGTVLASLMGTTGAAMLLIRPLLRANDNRKHNVHLVVFFIFLVANIGGGLTPLGDPPLFLGFLKGVDFFWTTAHMLLPVSLSAIVLLTVFYFIDSYYYKKEDEIIARDPTPDSRKVIIEGKINFILLLTVIGAVLLSGFWKPNITFDVMGTHLHLQNIVRDVLLIIIAAISLKITSTNIRQGNQFTWEPILEVAKLFIGIFITITPVIAILRAGYNGDLAALVAQVTDSNGQPINHMYFWMTGLLSGFLDNAPTYLVFFNLASGDAQALMHTMTNTLLAISMGSVFMGAITYIGNAPNFMVRSIAISQRVKMPSFFGYMKWSIGILIPLFIILSLIFF